MRNDAVSVLLAASRRARHVRDAPNPQCFPWFRRWNHDNLYLRTWRAERSGFGQSIL